MIRYNDSFRRSHYRLRYPRNEQRLAKIKHRFIRAILYSLFWHEFFHNWWNSKYIKKYDLFYDETRRILDDLRKRYGRFVVLDLHTYNHRRMGPDAGHADPFTNPEVNIGTGSLDREQWHPLVDRFMTDLASFDFLGRTLDVRENVRFRGGFLSNWIHQNYPDSGCCLAIELKKFFMDEWTGEMSLEEHQALLQALVSTKDGISETLEILA